VNDGREDKARGEHFFGGGGYYGLCLEDLVEVLWRSLWWFAKDLVGGVSQGALGFLGILGSKGQETVRVLGAREPERLCS
jgi:hypothetical protein